MKEQNGTQPAKLGTTSNAIPASHTDFNPLGKVEDINHDEVKVADIRRHFFGLFLRYIETILAIGLSLGLIIYLTPSVFGESSAAQSAVVLLSLVVIFLGAIFLVFVTKIYNANRLIITDIHITQVLQVGLFNKKVSELTMENVEDVTAEKHGIFSTIFDYGTLKVETAGEQNNFVFIYCPNPNAYAKALQDARAAYFKKHSGHRQPSNV
jgi:uncharacterized membrane protein YdbT with pleckstrin-like domain